MTWDDLAKRILEMPESERGKTVYYREPWDDNPEIFPLDAFEAIEDLSDLEGDVKIEKGETFLQ
jgi:hypothetical protein